VFAELGSRVAIGYFHNRKGAEEVRENIVRGGGKAVAIRADVCQKSEIRRLVKSAVDELGPIDILVNNAGSLVERMKIDEVTGEKWDGIQNLNLKSAAIEA
jgi:3-oxoacyl-[acyl-carrier protein] reductase